MKRLVVLVLVLIFVMSLPSAAFAETAQVGYGILEEAVSGDCVRVIVDLADNWSVGFYPMSFYLYDQPAYSGAADFLAYGVLMGEAAYSSLVESQANSEREDFDGFIEFIEPEGMTTFVAPIKEELYLTLTVDPATDAEAAFARVTWELEDYGNADSAQFVSGIIADDMDDSVQFNVTLDLAYSWSARFSPCAFYLYSADCEDEDDYDACGTLLNEQSYASLLEAQADSERTDKEGYTIFEDSEGVMTFVASIGENQYLMLTTYPTFDTEVLWESVSCEPFE